MHIKRACKSVRMTAIVRNKELRAKLARSSGLRKDLLEILGLMDLFYSRVLEETCSLKQCIVSEKKLVLKSCNSHGNQLLRQTLR